jgi:hypothetical protein
VILSGAGCLAISVNEFCCVKRKAPMVGRAAWAAKRIGGLPFVNEAAWGGTMVGTEVWTARVGRCSKWSVDVGGWHSRRCGEVI